MANAARLYHQGSWYYQWRWIKTDIYDYAGPRVEVDAYRLGSMFPTMKILIEDEKARLPENRNQRDRTHCGKKCGRFNEILGHGRWEWLSEMVESIRDRSPHRESIKS